jgi:hypothetical protein
MSRIAQALLIGQMGDDHFILIDHWREHFHREQAKSSGTPVKVVNLRRWIDEPKRMGLPRELQNLIILVFAEQTDRAFYQHGGVARPTIDDLDDELELRSEALPTKADWKAAHSRAQSIFGKVYPEGRNATNMHRLADEIQGMVKQHQPDIEVMRRRLEERLTRYGHDPNTADRSRTARAVAGLVHSITNVSGKAFVEALAKVDIATSETAMGATLAQASVLRSVLEGDDWQLFDALEKVTDERLKVAKEIIQEVRTALACDEHVESLREAVARAKRRAINLLAETKAPKAVSPPPPERGRRVVTSGERKGLTARDVKPLFEGLQNELEANRDRRASVQWSIDEPEGSS